MYNFIKADKMFNTIGRVGRDAGDIPILLGFIGKIRFDIKFRR